jgi:hypothetical protein
MRLLLIILLFFPLLSDAQTVTVRKVLRPVPAVFIGGQSNVRGDCSLTGGSYAQDQELPGYMMRNLTSTPTLGIYTAGRVDKNIGNTDFIGGLIDTFHRATGDTLYVLKISRSGSGLCSSVNSNGQGWDVDNVGQLWDSTLILKAEMEEQARLQGKRLEWKAFIWGAYADGKDTTCANAYYSELIQLYDECQTEFGQIPFIFLSADPDVIPFFEIQVPYVSDVIASAISLGRYIGDNGYAWKPSDRNVYGMKDDNLTPLTQCDFVHNDAASEEEMGIRVYEALQKILGISLIN